MQRLALGGSRDLVVDGQRGQERGDLDGAHVNRVPLAMEEDVPLDPVDVGLFGARAVVSGADGLADPVEKSRRRDGGRTGFTDGEPFREAPRGHDAISHCVRREHSRAGQNRQRVSNR